MSEQDPEQKEAVEAAQFRIVDIAADVPKAYHALFEGDYRDFAFFGGRGAGKSHAVAGALVLMAAEKPLRIVCAREVLSSVRDSVQSLIEDKISAFGLDAQFERLRDETRGLNGSRILYRGLARNPDALKSLEGADIFWAEEANRLATAFSRLVNELQEENARHMASIRTLREDAHKMRNDLTKLQAFAQALFRHIAVLERQILGLGAQPAARPELGEAV